MSSCSMMLIYIFLLNLAVALSGNGNANCMATACSSSMSEEVEGGTDAKSLLQTATSKGSRYHMAVASAVSESTIKTISIVMAAHGEQQYLVPTIDSILAETPKEVLHEIIIIDDASDPPLKPLCEKYDMVKVIRHEKQEGLIKSKFEGGNAASGDMLMFLDAHVKPEPKWYVPLLRHTNYNYKRVVVPVIPMLDGETWQINDAAAGIKMMFDWTLDFKWFDDHNDLVPCMSGGLFAITRKWWHESGEYDYGMGMWGGENIEQSIRVWLCGGEIYVARDSRVGHVFRKKFPYAINNTQINLNKVRAIETWFDDYKNMAYEADPTLKKLQSKIGDISSRLKLKEDLHCKPFKWYIDKFHKVFKMKNMLPKAHFHIRNKKTGLCIQSTGTTLVEKSCNDLSMMQRWAIAHRGSGLENYGTGSCLDANAAETQKAGMAVLVYRCEEGNPLQDWVMKNGNIRWGKHCIKASDSPASPLRLEECASNFLDKEGEGPFESVQHSEVPISVRGEKDEEREDNEEREDDEDNDD